MIDISALSAAWKRDGDWRIAPSGFNWIAEGNYVALGYYVALGACVTLGACVRLGDNVTLGNNVRLGDGCSDAIDLGLVEGYRKAIANVNGVAYIGAGCRWFTLAEAIAHWKDKPNRALTMCLMQSAVAIATLRGWK